MITLVSFSFILLAMKFANSCDFNVMTKVKIILMITDCANKCSTGKLLFDFRQIVISHTVFVNSMILSALNDFRTGACLIFASYPFICYWMESATTTYFFFLNDLLNEFMISLSIVGKTTFPWIKRTLHTSLLDRAVTLSYELLTLHHLL